MSKTDLTFAELNDALGGEAISFDSENLDIKISIRVITGDTYNNLSNEGVLEALYKIRSACTTAQNTANETLDAGDRLNSFPSFSFSPPSDGFVTVTQSHTVRIPLDTAQVVGTNV